MCPLEIGNDDVLTGKALRLLLCPLLRPPAPALLPTPPIAYSYPAQEVSSRPQNPAPGSAVQADLLYHLRVEPDHMLWPPLRVRCLYGTLYLAVCILERGREPELDLITATRYEACRKLSTTMIILDKHL